MERWKVSELFAELAADASRRVIFVEGVSDLSFWRLALPPNDRGNVAIYPADVVDLPVHNGMRGRLLSLAQQALDHGLSDRVRFFIDADYDRVLGRPQLPNVVFTDGRDMESYLILEDAFSVFCVARQDHEEATASLRNFALTQGRSIAMVRICSETYAWQLPFQATLEHRFSRYVENNQVNAQRLLATLVQNSLGLSQLARCQAAVLQLTPQYDATPDHEVIHGHDFVSLISEYLGLASKNVPLIVAMALQHIAGAIVQRPNVSGLLDWASD